MWVRVHTDEGVVGLGETYPSGESEGAVIHHHLAKVLLGRNPLDVECRWQDMFLKVSYAGWAGAEMRAISAVDIALWDILGKVCGQPVWQLLGGKCREAARVYNTCYDYEFDFNRDADKLAQALLAQGITAMKIWPFDEVALRNRGHAISRREMEQCLEPFRKIRDAVGDAMEIAAEFHGYWDLNCAIRIAQAIEPYAPLWLEEMLPQDNLKAYAELARATPLPLTISERLMTRYQFRELLELGAARIVNPDPCWCGGLTEAKKIADLADTYYIPIAPHNCGGPVLHRVCGHLSAAVPNFFIQETVRTYYEREHPPILTEVAVPRDGMLAIPQGAGLGAELREDFLAREDVVVAVTAAA